MNFELKKETLINLSDDAEVISKDMTPQIGGGDCHESDHCGGGGDGGSGYACLSIAYVKTGCWDHCEML